MSTRAVSDKRPLTHRIASLFGLLPLVAVASQLLLVVSVSPVIAAVSPGGDVAAPWPTSWVAYNDSSNNPVMATDLDFNPTDLDITSQGGTQPSVFMFWDGTNVFFRLRLETDPRVWSGGAPTKGGYDSGFWLANIATAADNTTRVVAGMQGKDNSNDFTYVINALNTTGETHVYETPFDSSGGVNSQGVRVVCTDGAGGVGVQTTTADCAGQVWLDWQVPWSRVIAVSGGTITANTPVKVFMTSSAAATLNATNKDTMTGAAVNFGGISSITPGILSATEGKSLVSGFNPPRVGAASVYDISLGISNPNSTGNSVTSTVVTDAIPAGVSIVSVSSATGSISFSGQNVTWNVGTLAPLASASATVRVSVTPTAPQVGTTITLANALSATGNGGLGTVTAVGTAQTVGPVGAAAHPTTTSTTCVAGAITYGATKSCTITVTDTNGSGQTQPTGTVATVGGFGTLSTCTLAGATASTSTCTVTFTSTGAGSGSVDATYNGDGTHNGSTATQATFTINKAPLTVTTVASSKVYGSANPAFTVSYSAFVGADNAGSLGGSLAFSTSATASSDVGTYAVTPSGLSSSNYAFTYVPANLTVTRAPLTISADNLGRAYGAANPTLTATYTGFVNGDAAADLDSPANLVTTALTTSAAGAYPITVSGATSTNYDITFENGTLTIGPVSLTVSVVDATKTYGDPNPAFGVTYAGFVNGDTSADLTGVLGFATAATAGSPVGTYPVTASGQTSADYTISYVPGTLTIDPAVLAVTPADQARPYGDPNPALTVTYTGFVGSDTVAVVGGAPACTTSAIATSPVGTYPIGCATGTLAATNYTFDVTATAVLSVGPASLTVTTDPATKTYGDPNPAFTVSYAGFVAGDTSADLAGSLGFTTAATAASDVGSYPVTPAGLSGANYAITFVGGSLAVTQATLTVTPDDAAIAVGDPIPTSFGVTYTGFVNGDDASAVSGTAACSTDAVAGDPAGTYTITCTPGTLASTNYAFVIGGTAIFTIGPVSLTVSVVDATKTYGDPNPAFGVTYAGFVNGDTSADLTGVLGFATAATAGSPVGTYPVTASGQTSADYTISYVPGTLTIDPVGQSIDFDVLPPATYGDSSVTLTATSSAGLPITYTTTGPCSVSGTTLTITGAGTCTVTAHQAGDANHDAATDVSQAFVVAKATPSVTWSDPENITYGTALSDTQLDALASVAGTYVYGPAAGEVLDAGTHTLLVTFTPTDGANYESVTLTVEITVEPAAQSIDFDALPPATNGDDPIALTATSSAGLPITYTTTGPCSVSGTTLTITGAGTCTVTAHQDGDANHEAAASVTVTFTITQPSIDLPNTSALEQEASPPGFILIVGGLFAFVLGGIVFLPARERRRFDRQG